jgi:ketosteroid isomerase-like protein
VIGGRVGAQEDGNREVVARYWEVHFRRDWPATAAAFADDCHSTDVGIGDPGATGPAEIIARLRLGIDPLEGYEHRPGALLVAEGDHVVTEHIERWRFPTGEVVDHPFASVMEVRDGRIARWHDYSHLGNLLDNAPAWWLERIAGGWRDRPDLDLGLG